MRTGGFTAVVLGLVLGAGSARGDAPADTTKKELEVGKWYPTLTVGIVANQSSYSSNWSGGDQGSIVWTALVNGSAERRLSPSFDWLTTLKLAYGQTAKQVTDGSGKRVWEQPSKSTDLIDLESIGRLTFGGWVDPFVSVRFLSQFQDASDPDGRTLKLNPLQFNEAAGISRKIVDEKDRQLLSRLGFGFRQSSRRQFVNPAPDRSTVSKGANDGGIEWVSDYQGTVLRGRVTWTSRLGLYRALFYSAKNDLKGIPAGDLTAAGIDPKVADFTTAIDADWQNIFTAQITKILSVNLYLEWAYDKYDNSVVPLLDAGGTLTNPEAVRNAVRKAGQFKETLAVGLTYRIL